MYGNVTTGSAMSGKNGVAAPQHQIVDSHYTDPRDSVRAARRAAVRCAKLSASDNSFTAVSSCDTAPGSNVMRALAWNLRRTSASVAGLVLLPYTSGMR